MIFLIVATLAVASAAESEITEKMKEFKIIPDLIQSNVPETLKVEFDSGAIVNMGNKIFPSEARNQPMVDWNADKNAYYTIMIIAPDAPIPTNPFLRSIVTWLVGNIPGKDVQSGDVLAEYFAISPPRGRGEQRGIYLLYKQPAKLHFDEEPIDKYTSKGRLNFSADKFSEKYGLGKPIAGNFYMSEFDKYALVVFDQLQCCVQYNLPEQ
ncbi:putative odorant-binding protein A5 [Episyrphus balteatus]|uniref:putative odorant-binding protein A5 n=1 Tax=Episyrphus balteatus TaxID=286459 RepID=UPI0024863046|nr:putative odorant-binding protein A5 [Episyrphus balteatus]